MYKLFLAPLFFIVPINTYAMTVSEFDTLESKEQVIYVMGIVESSLLTTDIAGVRQVFCPKENTPMYDIVIPSIELINSMIIADPEVLTKDAHVLILSTLSTINRCKIPYTKN
jgi:hypothetical protein